MVALMVGFAIQAQEIMLTQSVDPETVDDGGVACWDSTGGTYSANSFLRSYDLDDFGVEGDFDISELQFAQGSASDGVEITLNIYTADNTDLTVANMELVASTTHDADSADDLTLVTVPMEATIPAGSIVVFEVSAPDSGDLPGQTYFPGNNSAGQNAPSYLMSADCDINTPVPVEVAAGAEENYVMNVLGVDDFSTDSYLKANVSVYPNPVKNEINVSLPADVQVNNAVVVDMLGKSTPVSIHNGQMNLSNFSSGIYFLKLNTNKGEFTQKIVKE